MSTEKKVRVGRVVSDRMQKTVVVAVEWKQRHPLYKKLVQRIIKFKAHDEGNDSKPGDLVRIVETRPLSKTKRWRVAEVLLKAEAGQIKPESIEAEVLEQLEPPKTEGVVPPATALTATEGPPQEEPKPSESTAPPEAKVEGKQPRRGPRS